MHWMFLPLKRYAEFTGRSRRKEYWLFFLAVILFYLVLALLFMLMMGGAIFGAFQGGATPGAGMMGAILGGGAVVIVLVITWLFLLVPSIAVGVRRLHDIDRTGWWLMLGYGPWLASVVLAAAQLVDLAAIFNVVSTLGFLVLLVFAVLPGTRGPNRYGADPKGEDLGKVFA